MSVDKEEIIGLCILIGCCIVFPLGIMCTGSLVDDSIAIKALEVQGFSNITIVEKDWLFVSFKGGGQDDSVKFITTATNPSGENVTVAVFAGWPFKGATIRTP